MEPVNMEMKVQELEDHKLSRLIDQVFMKIKENKQITHKKVIVLTFDIIYKPIIIIYMFKT